LLHRSFPEADIDLLVQHFDVLYGGIADFAAVQSREINVRFSSYSIANWQLKSSSNS
jgi:hypothetical protein